MHTLNGLNFILHQRYWLKDLVFNNMFREGKENSIWFTLKY